MNNKQKKALKAKFSDGLGSSGMMVSTLSELCQDESDSPRSYEDRSPRNTKQQINKTVPRGRFFHRRPPLVLELLETIDAVAFIYLYITRSG